MSTLRDLSGREPAIDRHVGVRMRALRKDRDLGQKALGAALGVTFQQIQKYENGRNRLPASKLFLAADFLRVTPAYFFEGLPRQGEIEAADPVPLAQGI